MPIFADTLYFLALLQPSSIYHPSAVEFARTNKDMLVVTSAIVLELGNALSRQAHRPQFASLHGLITSGAVEEIFVTTELQARGLDRFLQRADKDWSLTDCISFVVMEEHAMVSAATCDRHFEQAGYVRLLHAVKS